MRSDVVVLTFCAGLRERHDSDFPVPRFAVTAQVIIEDMFVAASVSKWVRSNHPQARHAHCSPMAIDVAYFASRICT